MRSAARCSRRALADPAFQVRYEAVRAYSRLLQPQDCAPVLAAIDDVNAHVALAAIDALGNGCPAGPNPVARLTALTNELPKVESGGSGPQSRVAWHRPAHAFVALARLAREQATPLLGGVCRTSGVAGAHVRRARRGGACRGGAARAARGRRRRQRPSRRDRGVAHAARHDADAIYIAALARRDYQLVMLAAAGARGVAERRDRRARAARGVHAPLSREARHLARSSHGAARPPARARLEGPGAGAALLPQRSGSGRRRRVRRHAAGVDRRSRSRRAAAPATLAPSHARTRGAAGPSANDDGDAA